MEIYGFSADFADRLGLEKARQGLIASDKFVEIYVRKWRRIYKRSQCFDAP